MYGDLASVWLEIGEPEIAKPWIEKYELYFHDIRADQLWASYLINSGQKKAAADYMIEAESKAKDVRDWLANAKRGWLDYAELWHEIGEETASLRCMAKAEKLSGKCGSWLACADTWLKFEDEARARRAMKKAEAGAEDTWDWSSCSQFWKNQGDTAAVRRCLEGAEAIAKAQVDAEEAVGDWLRCSSDWSELGDNLAARRRAELAEARATSCWMLTDCARRWRTLGELAGAKRCLEAAEHCDDSRWANIARVRWALDEKARARQCVIKAQSEARENEDIESMVVCAETWRMFDDQEKTRRCVEWLECWSGKNTSRWCYCADTWRDFGFMADARRCLKEAETVAENDGDLLRCGQAWR